MARIIKVSFFFVLLALVPPSIGCGGEEEMGIGVHESAVLSDYYLNIGYKIEKFQMRNKDSIKCMKYDSNVVPPLVEVNCSSSDPPNAELWEAEVIAGDNMGGNPPTYEYVYRFKNLEAGKCLFRNAGPNEYDLLPGCSDECEFLFNSHWSLWWGFTQLTTTGHCMVSNHQGGAGGPPPQFVGENFNETPPDCVVGTLGDNKEWFQTKIQGGNCDWNSPYCDPYINP